MKTIQQQTKRTRTKGITLLEVTISSVLISLLTIAAMKTTGGVLRTWNQVSVEFDQSLLAEQLLGEILQASYEDPDGNPDFGIEAGETESPTNRSEFDDTDDYDDWSESPPQTKAGIALAGYTGWARSVDIKKLNSGNPTIDRPDNSADQGMRKITVTVTDPDGNTSSVSGWRASIGNPEQSKGVDGDFIVWVGCELKIGASGETVSAGTNIINHATQQ